MRAREPDRSGMVEVDGIGIAYEVFGDGEPTILLLPTWMILHSRFWKLQVPYLSRHFRVVTYDPPGNGKSERPLDPKAHGVYPHLRYTERMLDQVGADAAVLVGLSQGGEFGVSFAAERPDRVLGMVLIGPAVAVLEKGPSERARFIIQNFERTHPPLPPSGVPRGVPDEPGDWTKYNRQYWLGDLEDFAWFFFGQALPEPHSTKQIEDCVGWTVGTAGELLGAEWDAPNGDIAQYREWAARVSCPVLLIHGVDDRIVPIDYSEELARLTRGRLLTIEGAGHIPLARDPVKVNLAIRDFVEVVAA